MMGFYPDCPGEPAYTLSTPVFDKVTIKLDPKYWGRDQLVIETERPSAESLYIREMELGGKKLSRYRITHEELHKLYEASKGDPLELVILLASFYGLRRSEVLRNPI